MIHAYVVISWVIFAVVVLFILGNDICERNEWLGRVQDSKLGSPVTGIVWPITLAFAISFLPFVNLVWVVILLQVYLNRDK